MRKRTISNLFDNLMWFLVYSLPLIVMILSSINGSVLDFVGVFNSLGIGLVNDNVLTTCLIDMFGLNGFLPLVQNNGILIYFSYFIICHFIHLMIDCLLWLIRYCHKLLDRGLDA